jgi:hypothetical protein
MRPRLASGVGGADVGHIVEDGVGAAWRARRVFHGPR